MSLLLLFPSGSVSGITYSNLPGPSQVSIVATDIKNFSIQVDPLTNVVITTDKEPFTILK